MGGQPGVSQTERGDGQLSARAVPNKHRRARAHTLKQFGSDRSNPPYDPMVFCQAIPSWPCL